MNNKLFRINVQIMINRSLYKKKIIDEKTYLEVDEKLNNDKKRS